MAGTWVYVPIAVLELDSGRLISLAAIRVADSIHQIFPQHVNSSRGKL